MIRIEDKPKFEYLLNRSILASIPDLDGNNALHYAIRMERIEFISYLLEGEYHGFECLGDLNFITDLSKLQMTLNNITVNKSYMMNTYSQMNHSSIQQNTSSKTNSNY